MSASGAARRRAWIPPGACATSPMFAVCQEARSKIRGLPLSARCPVPTPSSYPTIRCHLVWSGWNNRVMERYSRGMTATSGTGRVVDAEVVAVRAQLTEHEKASMVAGVDDWHVRGVPRLGIPPVRVTDCGHGVTLAGDRSSPATCLPTGIAMASTWNTGLLERAGAVIGREARALGCSLLLGPKLNLHRHPLNGRSFETFSEDPWLAGLLGAAVVRGIQGTGVGACVKALTANNQQRDQEGVSSEVAERPLRELYLRAFQLAVDEGRPIAVMTSYNKVNGEYPSASRRLLRDVLK